MAEDNYVEHNSIYNGICLREGDLESISRSENFTEKLGTPSFSVFGYQKSNSVVLIEKEESSAGKYNIKIHGRKSFEIKTELSNRLPGQHFL